MTTTIFFDMDGTIADLYGVTNWLDYLTAEDALPYTIAKPLISLSVLARMLNRLQKRGFRIGVITWLPKNGSNEYNSKVTTAKQKWLKQHLSSVHFNEVNIVKYGTPKENFIITPNDLLFDDEEKNRTNWTGISHNEKEILNILKAL